MVTHRPVAGLTHAGVHLAALSLELGPEAGLVHGVALGLYVVQAAQSRPVHAAVLAVIKLVREGGEKNEALSKRSMSYKSPKHLKRIFLHLLVAHLIFLGCSTGTG